MEQFETYAEIQKLLEVDGTNLTFSRTVAEVTTIFTILGSFGWSTSFLRQESSFAEVEQTELNFYVATKDIVDNTIVAGETFTIVDDSYIYTLKILRTPINMMNNWSRIPSNFVSKVAI